MSKSTVFKKIIHFPLTKILVGLIVCAGVIAGVQLMLKTILEGTGWTLDFQNLMGGFIVALLALIVYHGLFMLYERRTITELSLTNFGKNLLTGFVLGAGLQSLTIFVIFINGGFSILAVNSFLSVLPALGMAFSSAIVEEILFRGIIYRIAEEKLGSYLALAISASLFGAAHLANPNSSLLAGAGIAIQAGVFLGAAFIYSKNLWMPIALHFAWNFTQAGIFGATTSGNSIGKSLLTTSIEGNEIISGGAFGPEGSIQATLFCFIAAIVLMIANRRQNKIVKPYWIKLKNANSSSPIPA